MRVVKCLFVGLVLLLLVGAGICPWSPGRVSAGNTDIGNAATDRASYASDGYTRIDKGNPASANFLIVTVEIWAVTGYSLSDCKIGTFYNTSGQTFVCRDSATLGTVTGGSKQTFNNLEIEAQTGDFIGAYWSAGRLEWGSGGSTITVYSATGGDFCDPADSTTYTNSTTGAFSMYGTGNPQITCVTSAASLVGPTGARLNGTLAQTTGTDCNVTFYWGDNDGGTTAGNWDSSALATSPSQPMAAGTCYANVHDLSGGVLYYFRLQATDGEDTTWAPSGQTFTTLEGGGGEQGEAGVGIESIASEGGVLTFYLTDDSHYHSENLTGATGAAGSAGAKGDKGDKGDQGEPGEGGGGMSIDWEGETVMTVMLAIGAVVFLVLALVRRGWLFSLVSCVCAMGVTYLQEDWARIVGAILVGIAAILTVRFAVAGRSG